MRVNGKLRAGLVGEGAGDCGRAKFSEVEARGGKFGVIGSNHTTNEENYYLQKFARQGLGTEQYRSPPHRRCGDACSTRLSGRPARWRRTADLLRTQGRAGGRRGPRAGAAVPGVPDSRQLPASRGACLCRHARARCAKMQYADGQRSRRRRARNWMRVESIARRSLQAEPELVISSAMPIKGDAVAASWWRSAIRSASR